MGGLVSVFFLVWVVDLFMYVNTEIFWIFLIFFSFSIAGYFMIFSYWEYLNQSIVQENKVFYQLIFLIRKKFLVIKNQISYVNLANKDNSFFDFFIIIRLSYTLSKVVRFTYNNLFKFRAYVFNILVSVYRLERRSLRTIININFLDYLSFGDRCSTSVLLSSEFVPALGSMYNNSIYRGDNKILWLVGCLIKYPKLMDPITVVQYFHVYCSLFDLVTSNFMFFSKLGWLDALGFSVKIWFIMYKKGGLVF